MDDCGSEKTIHYEEEGTQDGAKAFELAKHDYWGFLDYKEDRYTTVYGYMD